jgi:hypothetical protein
MILPPDLNAASQPRKVTFWPAYLEVSDMATISAI